VRHRIAANADGLRIAVVALGLVVLFFTGVEMGAVLVVGGLVALGMWGIEAVRRTTPVDPPPAEAEVDQHTER